MPNSFIMIPDAALTVRRRVNEHMVRQLISFTNFPSEAVIIHSAENDAQQKRLDGPNQEEIRTEYTDMVYANSDENYSEEEINQSLFVVGANDPVFKDEHLGYGVWPCYSKMDVVITLKFRSGSRTKLETWAKNLMLRQKKKPLAYNFDIKYDFSIPPLITEFNEHLYDLRQKIEPYNQTLEEYTNSIAMEKLKTRANASATHHIKTIVEVQRGVLGSFNSDFVFNNVGAKEAKNELSGTFTFSYYIPTTFKVQFPYIVHNQMVSSKFLNQWTKKNPIREEANREPNERIIGVSATYQDDIRPVIDDGIIRPFDFDPFATQHVYPRSRTYFITPIRVNLNNRFEVINLKTDLEEYVDSAIIDYIVANPVTCLEFTKAPYLLELISVGMDEYNIELEIKEDGSIISKEELSPRFRYYLEITILTDHILLDDKAITKFLNAPLEAVQALWGLVPGITVSYTKQDWKLHTKNGRRVTLESYHELLLKIKTTAAMYKEQTHKGRKSVTTINFLNERK